MEISPEKKRILCMLFLGALLIFSMVSVTTSIGLGKGGFADESVLRQQWFYVIPGVGSLVGIFTLLFAEYIIRKGDSTYGDSLSFYAPGDEPGIGIKFFKNPLRLTFLSIIIFSILGAISAWNQQTFTGVGVLGQQFTVIDSLIYSAALIPASENLGAAFIWAFFLFMWRYFARKHDVGRNNFIIVSILLSVVTFTSYGVINHLLRYGASDYNMMIVAGFWALGGFLTVMTGTFIVFWIMHIFNNLFYDLTRHFSNEIVIIWTVAIILVMIVMYILLFVRRKAVSTG